MKITAAVVRKRAGEFGIEALELCDPRDDELLVDGHGPQPDRQLEVRA